MNGVAAGAGASVALACDFRIASEHAKLVLAFIKVGLIPDSGGPGKHRGGCGVRKGGTLTQAASWGAYANPFDCGCTITFIFGYFSSTSTTCSGLYSACTEQCPFHNTKSASRSLASSFPPKSCRGSHTTILSSGTPIL